VITDDEVMRLFARADPARVDDDAVVIDAAGYLDALRTRSSNVTIIEPTPTPTEPSGGRRRTIILAAAAAAVVVVVGAVVLATRGDDDTAPITNRPLPTNQPSVSTEVVQDTGDAAVEVAQGFVAAYGALDADQAVTYLADDADITGMIEEYNVQGNLDQLPLVLAWLEAIDYQQMLRSCEEQSRSADGIVLHCTYDFHSMGSDELGLGPYAGSFFDLTVRDGEIVRAAGEVDISESSPQTWEPFFDWMDANHPTDVAVMYLPSRNAARFTEESIRLWEQRTREYVDIRAAAEVAQGFVEAFGAFDAERVLSYLATDADITGIVELPTPEGLRLHLAWLEAIGHQQMLNSCAQVSGSADGTGIRCTYDFHSFGSDELGRGPFRGSYFDLTVRDGKIVRAAVVADLSEFSPRMWDPFATWMDANYPADADVMYDDAGRNGPRRTEEAIQLWEQHIQEYVTANAAET
jgi:hypothetical protein